jgi:hypothetical protein
MRNANTHRPALLALPDPETIPLPSQILVLVGPTVELHPLVLQSLFLRAQRGEHLGVIVADNHLDTYTLARFARAHDFNPATLLAQIEFSRPFTCHQLHHCVIDLVTDRLTQWRALYVLGLLDTFYDEDIRLPMATRLLQDILVQLRRIATQGVPVLVTISPPPRETTRADFVHRVMHSADALARPQCAAKRRVNKVPAWQPSPQAREYVKCAAYQMAMW